MDKLVLHKWLSYLKCYQSKSHLIKLCGSPLLNASHVHVTYIMWLLILYRWKFDLELAMFNHVPVQHEHNIIQIHNNVLWDWQFLKEYFWIFPTFKLDVENIRENFVNRTILWIWIMLWAYWKDHNSTFIDPQIAMLCQPFLFFSIPKDTTTINQLVINECNQLVPHVRSTLFNHESSRDHSF